MRTTINIPAEAFKIIKAEAQLRDISLGEAVGHIVMQAYETDQTPSEKVYYIDPETGMPVIKARLGGQVITSEMIYKAMAEEDY